MVELIDCYCLVYEGAWCNSRGGGDLRTRYHPAEWEERTKRILGLEAIFGKEMMRLEQLVRIQDKVVVIMWSALKATRHPFILCPGSQGVYCAYKLGNSLPRMSTTLLSKWASKR